MVLTFKAALLYSKSSSRAWGFSVQLLLPGPVEDPRQKRRRKCPELNEEG